MDIVAPTQAEDLQQLNEEQIKALLRAKGQKLGLLLAGSNIPNEVKEAIVTILPELSLQQIDDLLNLFETRYLLAKTGAAEAEKAFAEKLFSILEESEKKQEALATATLAKLDVLGKQLPE